MVPSDVRVLGDVCLLIGSLVLEDLENRLAAEPEEVKSAHHRPRVNVQMLEHPVRILMDERTQRIHVFASQDVDEEILRLRQAGHREADVIQASYTGQGHGSSFRRVTQVWIQNSKNLRKISRYGLLLDPIHATLRL